MVYRLFNAFFCVYGSLLLSSFSFIFIFIIQNTLFAAPACAHVNHRSVSVVIVCFKIFRATFIRLCNNLFIHCLSNWLYGDNLIGAARFQADEYTNK